MSKSSTEIMRLNSYQYNLFNKLSKRNKYYEDILGIKDRSEKTIPNMQQVIHADMERMKTNKVYDRKLSRDLNGPKGLNWQCKQELQRLRCDKRDVERDLIRLNRDLAKVSILPSISRSPSLILSQTPRLSSIAEEHSFTPMFDKPKITFGHSSSTRRIRSPNGHLVPIKKRSLKIKTNSSHEQSHSLSKHNFRQLIAKTSDDRLHHQQHANIIEHQRRLVEQKLKQFLH